MRLLLLGRFRVYRGGEEVPPAAFGGRKVRTLLRVLAVRRPDLVSYDALAEALWADRPPADPAANLNVLVNRARRALGDTDAVVTGPGGYALGAGTVDLTEFLDGVAAARRAGTAGDPATALHLASAALGLWGEPLAEDADADWARGPRDRLRRARVDALETAARAAAALGDPATAASYAADAVAAEPLRESAALVLAQALAAMGDRAAALAGLADLRRRLAEELGVDPVTGGGGAAPAAAARRATAGDRRGGDAPAPGGRPAFAELPFVGREPELALLRAVLAGTGGHRHRPRARPASASPGWCAKRYGPRRRRLIATRAFLAERAEAWSLARSLLRAAIAVEPAAARGLPAHTTSALTTILPELDDGRLSVPLDGESRRALILAGGLHVIETATRGGGVIVVDDVQWCDPSSAALLGSVLARLPRLAAALTVRSDEPPVDLLDGLRTAREVTDVALHPLTPAAVRVLVGSPELADALVDATDGSPFAIAEVLRELVARDAVRPGADEPAAAADGRSSWPARSAGRASDGPSGAGPTATAAVTCSPWSRCSPGRYPRAPWPPRPGCPIGRPWMRCAASPTRGWCGSVSSAGRPRTTSSARPWWPG